MKFIPFLIITVVVLVLAALLVVIIPSLATSVFSNPTKCPTGSAICSTAAMMPGAVSLTAVFIVLVSIGALAFVVFYIRSHS
jgi:hypothetical protein